MSKNRNRDSSPVSHWLGDAGELPGVTARARRLADLRERIQRMLPPGLSDHIELANYRNGEAIFMADSPVFQQRAHYLQAQLKRIAERCLEQPVNRVKILVTPRSEPTTEGRRPPEISEQVGPVLESAARGVSHSGLKTALTRLSDTAKRLRRAASEPDDPS